MKRFLIYGSFFIAAYLAPFYVKAASLSVLPNSGTFTVGSTFGVSVFLDTQNQSINAVDVEVGYPADKLQVVSPSTGESIIGVWTNQPRYDNQAGTVSLQGGVPGGINTSNGIITTITFRVKAIGDASVRILDSSKALLNDGLGTDVLGKIQNGIYNLTLPPPAGPIVASETH